MHRTSLVQVSGQLRYMNLPFSHIDIYHGFKFCLDSLGNDVDFDQMEEADIVKAQPPISQKAGCFDTVVVMVDSDCECTGLKGTRIGRLKVIFRLPQQVYGSVQPAWTKDPLAYVEWYAPLKPAAEDYYELYTVKKPLLSLDGSLPGRVISLSSIRQTCQLVPNFGRTVPIDWTSDNVLDKCDSFLLNCFTSKYAYQTLW
ncbi:uncharacterized protein HD556DRAFT_1245932 [Suillus plorans]|uniref:Uncharacterized protein n=1 Tax=Suillus plorans TaxID=116603 RepID=A0A9P7DD42_9AGAM|nr:uncharacterized protein HD556DRAFT_1245932 [Suillus plorans]KAG1787961.1 hypothetical protein HD556DRAFT_1245932 [Suillus plorans]